MQPQEREIKINLTCMQCGNECDIYEYLEEEIWCYCKMCKIDTFHPLTPQQQND